MKKRYLIPLLIIIVFLSACQKDANDIVLQNPIDAELFSVIDGSHPEGISHYVMPKDDEYSLLPADAENPVTREKVELGKMFFFETALSIAPMKEIGSGTYSCGSCHVPELGFKPGIPQGIGEGGIGNGTHRTKNPQYFESEMDVQGVGAPGIQNVAWVNNVMHNGQFGAGGSNIGTEHLWNVEPFNFNNYGMNGSGTQPRAGLFFHRMDIDMEFFEEVGYAPMLQEAFPTVPYDSLFQYKYVAYCISSYLRTVTSNDAPVQKWMKGDKSALTEQEKLGGVLFFTKAGCVSCHNGKAFGGDDFYAVGGKDLWQNSSGDVYGLEGTPTLGRGSYTGNELDNYKFSTPQLYNLREGQHFFHGSSFTSVREVIEYFNNAQPQNDLVPLDRLDKNFVPKNLTEDEMDALEAFIVNGCHDEGLVEEHTPDRVLSGNCIPNNDPIAQLDCN